MNLHIRNVDATLVTQLKHDALAAGVTLRAYVISKLGGRVEEGAVEEESESGPAAEGDGGIPF